MRKEHTVMTGELTFYKEEDEMKASEKIKGIVYAYNTGGEYDMVRELGVEWLRLNICFP